MTKTDIVETDTKEIETDEEVKTFTEEEVNKMIQSATDKRVTEALKTNKEKLQAEYEQKLEEERENASLSEEEKYQKELDRERAQFEKERAQFLREKNELFAVKALGKHDLPSEFSGYVLDETEEDIESNIEQLKEVWANALEKSVNTRLAGKTPQSGNAKSNTLSVSDFKSMNYHERAKLQEENPEQYADLSKRSKK